MNIIQKIKPNIKNKIKKILGVGLQELKINHKTKCLIICPHADDDAIGCGGFLSQYGKHFDSICISSGGLPYKYKEINLSAKERSDIRINEWNNVMNHLGIEKTKIIESYGAASELFSKIKKIKISQYFQDFNLQNYDYIFAPYQFDSHPEHAYATNVILKKALKKYGYKKNLKIVLYEVWTPILKPNFYFDISSFVDKKINLIKMYPSQLNYIDYVKRAIALNQYRGVFCNNCHYAESYKIISVKKFLYFNRYFNL